MVNSPPPIIRFLATTSRTTTLTLNNKRNIIHIDTIFAPVSITFLPKVNIGPVFSPPFFHTGVVFFFIIFCPLQDFLYFLLAVSFVIFFVLGFHFVRVVFTPTLSGFACPLPFHVIHFVTGSLFIYSRGYT